MPESTAAIAASKHLGNTMLPPLSTTLADEEIMRRLDGAARRGKLAGFHPHARPALFSVTAYGDTFDYRLIATRVGAELRFALQTPLRVLAIFWGSLAITIWPGMWLTDSMLTTYFSWYQIPTWTWYLPVTLLPVPWMLKTVFGKSRVAAVQHAQEQITRIGEELGGGEGKG